MSPAIRKTLLIFSILVFLPGCELFKKNNSANPTSAGGGGGGSSYLPLACTLAANQNTPAIINELGTDSVPLIIHGNGPADSASMGILNFTQVNIDPHGAYLGTFDAIPDASGNFTATIKRGNEVASCSVKAQVTVQTGPVCRMTIDNGTLHIQLSSSVSQWTLNVGDAASFGPMGVDNNQVDVDISYDDQSLTIDGITIGVDTNGLVLGIGLNDDSQGMDCQTPLQ